ncbi:hypothetical protein WR25_25032 [Diploscapter pachys]|uniref:BIG2 domain-containing protein n=1 Tax=Diploscapter pachys TaxID=2018661 RepID=A0A2A2JKK1_9BILA|nr:hypothetical protein WR25_25032 [Diploscapter pachys]
MANSLLVVCTCLVVWVWLCPSASSYLVNEPRVLLPQHPDIPVNFTLKITEPSGGCFTWRSNRPDIATIHPVGSDTCSDTAIVRSVPKALSSSHPSTIIFIDEKSSGVHLSCTVQVAEIHRIQIETVAKMLYIDADPSRMMLKAYDAEGDVFSSLGELPVEWELGNTIGSRPLRIVSFDKSSYEAPKEIILLEERKKKGHTILLEGVSTGSATLTARFSDHHFNAIAPTSLDLMVVASLVLQPSVVYVPVQANVKFSVFIIKQNLIEAVKMPSPDYYLQVADASIATLNSKESTVRALQYGTTQVELFNKNIKEQSKLGSIRLPSTPFFVVDPDRIEWRVDDSSNFLLQKDTEYLLALNLLTEDGNSMLITDNMLFESHLDAEFFKVVHKSANQSYFKVVPLKKGKTTVRSKYVAIVDEHGVEQKQSGRVKGEQELQIVDPVKVVPSKVYLPYLPKQRVNFELKATGGSGVYDWNTEDAKIADVDANGVAAPISLGQTRITAIDRRNKHMMDHAEVSVVEITSIGFGETRKEAIEGTKLVMNLQLYGEAPDGSIVPVTDCRAAQIYAKIGDERVARVDSASKPLLPSMGTGCATLTLSAIASGNTKVTVTFGRYTASTDIAIYPKMQTLPEQLGLALNSEFELQIQGGPRPWIDDPTSHFINAKSKLVTHTRSDNRLRVICGKEEGTEKMIISMGNKPSTSLPLPLVIDLPLQVCCANPNRLDIARPDRLSTCPGKTDAILIDSKARYVLQGYAQCGSNADRLLDSVSGLAVNWKSADTNLLMLNSVTPDETTKQPTADVLTRRKSGTASLSADVKLGNGKKLHTEREIIVATPIQINPDPLLVWNERGTVGEGKIEGGSGHFTIIDRHSNSLIRTEIKARTIEVFPLAQGSVTLTVKDLCIADLEKTINVRVVQIHGLSISAPEFVGVNDIVDVEIVALDEHGEEIPHKSDALSNVKLETSNDRATLQRQSSMHYSLRGAAIGSVALTASANSSTGHRLISRPKSVQIFSPIKFDPTKLTLIPEAVFQLQVLGGPQPTPPIAFSLNNSKIARIEPNGLITSLQTLGTTAITGTLHIGNKQITKDTVLLRVVSLRGIRLVTSSHQVETDGRVHVRVEGIDEDETPFAFGGAIYPIKIEWDVSHEEILSSKQHPIVASMNDDAPNQFAIWLRANKAGKATIKVRAHLHAKSHNHFAGSARLLEATTEIEVVEPLQLDSPSVPMAAIRMSPQSSFQLSLQKWGLSSGKSTYSSSSESSLLTVSSSGRLTTHSREGVGAVVVRQAPDNRTLMIPVSVSRVHSLHVRLSSPSPISVDSTHLPVGLTIPLDVLAFDSFGQPMHVTDDVIFYRPHRFDLTDIQSSNYNRSLSIHLKFPGETVLKVWLRDHPQVDAFIRLPVAGWIFDDAHRRAYVQSDVTCLKSPFAGSVKWTSSSRGIKWIDAALGIAQLTAPGEHKIAVTEGEQTLDDSIQVLEPKKLAFDNSHPTLLTTQPDKQFVFPVHVQANQTQKYLDCTAEQRSVLSQDDLVDPPFHCSFHFSNKAPSQLSAAYWLTSQPKFDLVNGYSCVLSRLEVPTEEWKFDMKSPAEVTLEAKWNDGSQRIESASVAVPFHFATVVFEEEIHLSDLENKPFVVSVSVPSYQERKLTVRGCDLVAVSPVKRPEELANAPANVFYAVSLNTKSAALFEEWRSKCNVTIANSETGQTIEVPVRIRMVSDTTSLLEAMSRKSWHDMIYSLVIVCVIGIVSLLAYKYYKSMTDKPGFVGVTTSAPLSPSSMLVSSFGANRSSLTNSIGGSSLDNGKGISIICLIIDFFDSLLRSGDSPVFRTLHRNTSGARGDSRLWSDGSKENVVSPYRRRM